MNIMMMTIMIMKKTEQLISIHFNVDSPPLKITFFVRIAHGREVFERQDTILEIDQLGINMEDNIMSQRTELQKRTKKMMISEVIYFNLFHKSHVICSVATKHGVGTWCSVRLWNGIRLPNRLSIFHKPHMIWKKNKSKFDLGQPSIGSGIVISCLSRHKTIEQGAPHSRFFCSHIAVDDEHL